MHFGITKIKMVKMVSLSVTIGVLTFVAQDNLTVADMLSHPSIAKTREYQSILLADAIHLFYSSGTIIVDVRKQEFYDYGHIERAINLPAESVAAISSSLLERLRNAPSVMVYCNGNSCSDAASVASFLKIHDVSKVNVYSAGWPEWEKCHLPVVKNTVVHEAADEK
jgi:rhodanese-related sulfurtransferase